MDIDIAAHLGATSRIVENRTHDGKPAKVVIAQRSYDTSVEDLWNAVTTPDRLARWFAPVEGDLKLGGKYQVKGNAGGTITACEPPKSFSLTWEFGGGVSWVNIAIAPTGEGAHLTLEHIAYPEDHWKTFGPSAVGIGWELGLLGLGMHIRDAAARDAFDGNTFHTTPGGKHFMKVSGEGWIAADTAGGEDVSDAEQRGRRTIAFYSGEPPPDSAHPGSV